MDCTVKEDSDSSETRGMSPFGKFLLTGDYTHNLPYPMA